MAGCSTTAVPFDATDAGTIPHDEEVPTPSQAPDGQAIAIQVASTTDIPVGGGAVIVKDNIVVTQPVAGEFKAFSAVCPHVGCLLDKVANETIDCPCHGSTFRISDGSVVTGPATRPLTPVPITVTDGMITIT
jgi:nitrite reductase/ring-hydroxylating ferredoxin subunit